MSVFEECYPCTDCGNLVKSPGWQAWDEVRGKLIRGLCADCYEARSLGAEVEPDPAPSPLFAGLVMTSLLVCLIVLVAYLVGAVVR